MSRSSRDSVRASGVPVSHGGHPRIRGAAAPGHGQAAAGGGARAAITAPIRRRARGIRLLVLDVDGVLTDAGMYYGERGEERKKFNTHDGHGIALLQAVDIRVAIVTRERTAIVARRAAKLRIEDVHQGALDKLPVVQGLAAKHCVSRDATCYVGDDLGDLEPMRWAGFSVAVADALPPIRRLAHWVTRRGGGQGAVREVCDLILAAQGKAPA